LQAPPRSARIVGEREQRTLMTSSGTDAYTVARREDALDFMADYPGYGEQRWYTSALAAEQVSFSWRRMLPGTGGRGSYGHRHPGQEEVYFVISGTVTFKIDDDVFEAGPQTAVRIGGDAFRSVHNDTDDEAQLLIFSRRLDEPPMELQDDFWPAA
jgi:mannose-6-phosphate isomerase-like protein (cupin superfamily)